MFQNNAMFKPCWGIIILLLVKSVKLGQLFPMGRNQRNVLINVSYNGRASDDNTVLFFAILYTKLLQLTLYLRCERVVKRSSGMSEKMGDGICAKYGSKVAKF